ncbi:Panacea domain-containing protein [Neobacillus niacini]|uniref:Panacea domain-containing protein n=1 Tax=Neobacillus niacini TaxID=86668 RepID=UPI0020404E19|nr:type II toxin-antitoxin system antitoxin SocA domain-containing protein [Neobacillus niacini]MCM3692178.1 DUF4065 domain-containing protein [Neobacillus niacini]
MYEALMIAFYFINRSVPNTNESVTNLKLQKLLYYAQGFYIARHPNRELLFPDTIEAWVHGPVVPNVYRHFSNYKYHDIVEQHEVNIAPEDIEVLDMVWETFRNFSGKELERITHQEEPWLNARNNLAWHQYSNTPIDPYFIADYFEREYLGGV